MLFSLIVLVATGILITSFTVIQTLFCDGKGTQFEKLHLSGSEPEPLRLRNFHKEKSDISKSESLLDPSESSKRCCMAEYGSKPESVRQVFDPFITVNIFGQIFSKYFWSKTL